MLVTHGDYVHVIKIPIIISDSKLHLPDFSILTSACTIKIIKLLHNNTYINQCK